ncbi:xanthine dehydrogenase family protein subunit M [Nitratireductor aquimarinus]|uniref:Xanthine dehydrogenase family protein subunit M n=1 Tax=Nitratireductor aquimarinus TaxID=889300 RepID=A0ABU4APA1_9HYPH|nr:xanthine dehydrogenase family protein subunit M [Nitratireductor aquimarinus]MDV6228060.1 xanthine dehydrogenase family protein subunit M [Nitratireductor aquimarinus]
MNPFCYRRAESVEAAAAFLGEADEASLLAGGQTLLPTMKQGLAAPDMLVDLAGISALKKIRIEPDAIIVGAMCTHAQVAGAEAVRRHVPGLAALAGEIGDAQVRNRGTLGGSIANNDPAADYPAACAGLGATVLTDRREIGADAFFLGLFETALEEGEIITGVRFPLQRRSAYLKFRNPASRFAIVGVFVAGVPGSVRVAITGAGRDGVFRWSAAEEALNERFHPEALERLALPLDDMLDDIHASGEYRAHLAKVLAGDAVAEISGVA